MDLDSLSLEDLKNLKAGNLDGMSVEGLQHLKSQSQTAQAPQRMDTPSWVPSIVKNAAGMVAAKQAGLANAATLGYGNLEDLPGVGQAFKEASDEHPMARMYGGVEGSVGPGAAMGAAVAPLAATRYLNNPVGRTAVNAGMGGLEGLIRKPQEGETRLSNAGSGARNAALIGGGMEALAGAAKSGGKLAQWLGRKLGGLTAPEAEAYKNNPQDAERLAETLRNDPKGLSDEVRSKIGGGLEETFDKLSEPALDKVGKAVAHKSVQVRPNQFSGSAAQPEIERAWNLRNPERFAPYQEVTPYQAEVTPVESRLKFGAPEDQTAFMPNRPYDSPTVPVQTVESELVRSGPDEVASKGFIPGKMVYSNPTTPTPIPDNMALRGPQALRAKRAAQKAASYKQALNPQGYSPADDVEAKAADRLKLGLEGAAPDVVDANNTLSEAARYSGAARAKFSNNPAAILTDSESTGSVPSRSMRQFIDKHGGAGLEDMANRLAAGKALGDPSTPEGMWSTAKRLGAKASIRASGKSDDAAQILRDMKLRALLGAETEK